MSKPTLFDKMRANREKLVAAKKRNDERNSQSFRIVKSSVPSIRLAEDLTEKAFSGAWVEVSDANLECKR